MKDYIFLQWSQLNDYRSINSSIQSSNLIFLVNFFSDDYKPNDKKLFIRAVSFYNISFVYNDLENKIFYIGYSDWEFNENIDAPNIEQFNNYVTEINSCKISYDNFIELAEKLMKMQSQPALFAIMYRDDNWIDCESFDSKEEMELFVISYKTEKLTLILKKIEEASSNEIVNAKIIPLIKEVNITLEKIRSCRNIDEAAYYFDLLQAVQGQVSLLISKDEIELPSSLWKLYTDFDRIDDPSWREYIFTKIKKDNYSLEGRFTMHERFRRTL
ncbi:MAG: hypothetical protein JO129_03895 [Candidatus Dependentiae bacterium]|nr:hypothetical protein [Candidatus Dependentiae bacterium]